MTNLLDMPLISEMDAIERKAQKGDEHALAAIYAMLTTVKRIHVDRLMRVNGWPMKKALEDAGLIICSRETKQLASLTH